VGSGPSEFLANPQLSTDFCMLLTTTVWVGLAVLFLSAWWVVENFLLGLNANCFLYPLSSEASDVL